MNKTYTNYHGNPVVFDVIVDDVLRNLSLSTTDDLDRKSLLSLINGFEDGDWMTEKFETFIWDHIEQTALSKSERDALIGQPFSILKNSAKKLRLLSSEDDNKGGEIGEILLYGVMNKYFGALPVVPKIFYKQNASDYAKGADSVHIVLDSSSDYSLWLGESKFYNSVDESRLQKIVLSIEELLKSEKLKKEFTIVTSLKELEKHVSSQEVRQRITNDLKDGISLDDIKKRLHVPILILFECEITSTASKMSKEYQDKIKTHHLDIASRYVKKQNELLKAEVWGYADISFHMILFPVPEKDSIVKRFFEKAGLLKT